MQLQKNDLTFLLDLIGGINMRVILTQLKPCIYWYLPEFLLYSSEQHSTVAKFH